MAARPEDRNPGAQAPQGWSLADDYLADPAVAPLRALLGAVARRLARRRGEPLRRGPAARLAAARPARA